MLERQDLYDPELVSALSRRDLPGPPFGFPLRGIHRSAQRGASLEFSEHTEYTPGDDLRHLDWKVYGKSDRFFVKRYEDERLQRVHFLVDASGSMAYGKAADSLRGSKYHLGARLAVALAACLLRQGDAVGLEVAGGEERASLPPRAGSRQLDALLEVLGGVRPAGEAGLGEACRSLAERAKRSGSAFLVSDLLDEEVEELEPVRLLAARGVRPRLLHLLHADEVDLPFENTSRFMDLEGPEALVLDPLSVRRSYREEIDAHVRALAQKAEHLGVPYTFLVSGDDPAPHLSGLLRQIGRG